MNDQDDETPHIVRYERKPLTAEQLDRLKKLSERPDEEIDFSDIPEATEEFWANAKRGLFYRPLKKQLTLRLDAPVLDWFKRRAKNGKGYQTDINRVLSEYVAREMEKDRKKAG